MDYKSNESINKNFAKSQVNFMDTKMSQNRANELNYKTAKLYNIKQLPSLKSNRSTSNIRHGYNYTLRETKLGFNSMLNNELSSSSTVIEYDPKTLKNDLLYLYKIIISYFIFHYFFYITHITLNFSK